MRVTLSTTPLEQQKADCLALVVAQDFEHATLNGLASYQPNILPLMERQEFIGKNQQVFTTSGALQQHIVDIVAVGVGPLSEPPLVIRERYRRALGKIVRTLEHRSCDTVAIMLPDVTSLSMSAKELVKEATIALQMAAYHFDEFISDVSRKIKGPQHIILVVQDLNASQAGLDEGLIIAQAVNMTRHWIDLPPVALTPVQLAVKAQEIAKKYALKYTQFDEDEAIQMGMGGLAGVSRGSDEQCRFVILEYHCGDDNAPTLGFVGKGITFDSGGLSIKPAANMETMKDDMSGAAAVISTMQVIAQLKPTVNVIAFAPLSENLPSGKATKPGDILRFYNGKTAEVKNTDAEGRLILADALSYAIKHYKLDALIDLATLTGACAHALGPFFSGMMSQHPDLAHRVQEAGDRCGDRVWPLPLDDDYKIAIKSPVADICNIGSSKYRAGAITAAFFLQNFVGDVPWVHLDIAGTAFEVPDIPYYRPEGATGVGVRLLTELAMNWR